MIKLDLIMKIIPSKNVLFSPAHDRHTAALSARIMMC